MSEVRPAAKRAGLPQKHEQRLLDLCSRGENLAAFHSQMLATLSGLLISMLRSHVNQSNGTKLMMRMYNYMAFAQFLGLRVF